MTVEREYRLVGRVWRVEDDGDLREALEWIDANVVPGTRLQTIIDEWDTLDKGDKRSFARWWPKMAELLDASVVETGK